MNHLNNLVDIKTAIGGVFSSGEDDYYYKIYNAYFLDNNGNECRKNKAYEVIFDYNVYNTIELTNSTGEDYDNYRLSNESEINLINKFISRLKFQNKDFDYFSPQIKIGNITISEYELNNYKNCLVEREKEIGGTQQEIICLMEGFNAAIKYLQELDKK